MTVPQSIRILTSDNRVLWIDCARAFAILFVVLCHSVEALYLLNQSEFSLISTRSFIFGLSSFTIGRSGVPIFLFINWFSLA